MAPTLPPDPPDAACGAHPGSEGDTTMSAHAALQRKDTTLEETAVHASPPQCMRDLTTQWSDERAKAALAWDRHVEAEAASCAIAPPYPEDCKAFDAQNALALTAARAAGEAVANRVARRPRPPSYDLWRAQRNAIAAAYGLAHLEQTGRQVDVAARALRDQIFATPALSLADLAAKVTVLFAHMKDEDIEDGETLAAVTALNRDLEAMTAPREPPSQEVLESYNAWLFMERRLLSLEMYPEQGPQAERFVPAGNAGDAWHFMGPDSWQDKPQPSTRAATILHSLGVLPEPPE